MLCPSFGPRSQEIQKNWNNVFLAGNDICEVKLAAEFKNHIFIAIWQSMTSLWRHKGKNQTLYSETENRDSGAKWVAEFKNHIYFTIRATMTSLWRHKRQNIKLFILRRKIAILVQNKPHNSKITFISWFEELWRHYNVTNVKTKLSVLRRKAEVLVQNEPLNSKIAFILWFEQIWRHYVQTPLSQKLDYLFWHEQ